jgi:ABC-2 type transport system permease protein
MFRLIAEREFIELWRDGRLHWTGGLMLALILVALAVGWQRQQAIESERVVAQALDYDDWLNQSAKHPHDATHQGMHVFKPAPPLSIVDPGIEPFVGSALWLQAHRQSEMKFRPAQDATGLQRFGNLSVAWVLQVLGPLLIIVLGFSSFAGERETGTLRQTLSLGVPAQQVLWGKALALAGVLALLLVPVLSAATVVVATSAAAEQWGAALVRLAWLALGYALYFASTIFLVLAVSAKASSSRLALISLLGIWIAAVVLAPRVGADLARLAYPSPNRLQFDTALGGDLSQVKGQAWQQSFGVSMPWSPELPLNKWGIALQVDDHAGYGVIDEHFSQLWDSFEAQQRAQEWPGLVFPILALRGFSMGIAGTDFAHHRDFANAAETQRRLMQDLVSQDLVENADPLGDQHFGYQADSTLWQRVPRFTYQSPSAATAVRQNLRSLLVLLLACIGMALLAHRAARRPLYQ